MFPFGSETPSSLPTPSYVPLYPALPVLARADSRSRLRRSFEWKMREFPSANQLRGILLPV